jgi:hypothetical protein
MAIAALTLLGASAIHFGLAIEIGGHVVDDPFAGAALPEAVIGAVLAAGVAVAFSGWRRAWPFALGATLFGILGVLVGLSFTVRSGRTGDLLYHLGVLVTLLFVAGVLARDVRAA